ncbi:MAG: hypothetical protein ACLSHO_11080 [Dysosmobacter sp.]
MALRRRRSTALRPHMDNNAYTHCMLWEAQTGDVLTGLVTLLNCSWSYAYVAEKIVERCPDALRDKRYGSWFCRLRLRKLPANQSDAH